MSFDVESERLPYFVDPARPPNLASPTMTFMALFLIE